MKIDGSVAVVTGAGSGIGRSIAAGLPSAGASVVASDIDAASAAETAALIGGVAVAADAANTDGIATLRAHIRAAKAVVPEWLERASGHFVAVASAAWRRLPQRQTARTPHRHHPSSEPARINRNGGRLKHPDPQVLTIALEQAA